MVALGGPLYREGFTCNSTGIFKKLGTRFCELELVNRINEDTESHNIRPILLSISVYFLFS